MTFGGGELELATAFASQSLSAEGEWTGAVTVPPGMLRALNRRLPDGNPLEVTVHNDHLNIGGFSISCVVRLQTSSTHVEAPPACTREMLALAAKRSEEEIEASGLQLQLVAARYNASQCLSRASAVLTKLKVHPEAIEALVKQAIKEPRHPLTEHEHGRINAIADAWKALAPLGVSLDDIRDLVDRAVREGWKTHEGNQNGA